MDLEEILKSVIPDSGDGAVYLACEAIVSRLKMRVGIEQFQRSSRTFDGELSIICQSLIELPELGISGEDLMDEFNELIDRLDIWLQETEVCI